MLVVVVAAALADRLQCKDPNGQPVDWFTAIKLPNLKSNVSDGTVYVYMDAVNTEWTFLTGITTKNSAIGHTVSQMYAPSDTYNNSILWITYNDQPSNKHTTFTLGHSKGTVVADRDFGFWLVHSVPHFPQLPYQNNSYSYPKTGVLYGQSFLCVSMMAQELDKVGNQIINNEALVYGSHFGGDLKSVYPTLYNSTLPHGIPCKDNDGVRLQYFQSIKGSKFLSVSKNRHFGKDLYHDLITNLTKSNVYTETWLNSADAFNSTCSGQYKAMNIKSLDFKFIKGLESCSFRSSKDHSKWMVTGKNSVPWTCVGDVNRAHEQTQRGGGTMCIKSIKIWNEFKKLVSKIENCI